MIELSMPFPPPVNNLFTNGSHGRRVPSKRYTSWRGTVASEMMSKPLPTPINGPFKIEMAFERPCRRKRDLDGLAKAPLDMLVALKLIEDDHWNRRLVMKWLGEEPVKGARVFLRVEAI